MESAVLHVLGQNAIHADTHSLPHLSQHESLLELQLGHQAGAGQVSTPAHTQLTRTTAHTPHRAAITETTTATGAGSLTAAVTVTAVIVITGPVVGHLWLLMCLPRPGRQQGCSSSCSSAL